jgi:hypothetical protein
VAGLCLLSGTGALAGAALDSELVAVGGALAAVGLLLAKRIFGHAELALVGQRLAALARPGVRGEPREVKVRLQGSADWQELWEAIVACARPLNLTVVRLDVNAPALQEGYHARWDRPHSAEEGTAWWRAEVPLVAHGKALGRLEIVGVPDNEPVWKKIARLARLVEDFEATATVLTTQALKPASPPAKAGPHVIRIEKVYSKKKPVPLTPLPPTK